MSTVSTRCSQGGIMWCYKNGGGLQVYIKRLCLLFHIEVDVAQGEEQVVH